MAFAGHSSGVAELAARAATLTSADATFTRRAGLVHDLGRVAVPTGIWERPGPLRHEEWELFLQSNGHSRWVVGDVIVLVVFVVDVAVVMLHLLVPVLVFVPLCSAHDPSRLGSVDPIG